MGLEAAQETPATVDGVLELCCVGEPIAARAGVNPAREYLCLRSIRGFGHGKAPRG